jgi:hypothetical protein
VRALATKLLAETRIEGDDAMAFLVAEERVP